MCFHRIVQNPFFRLLGHLNPIGKEGIFTVCLVGYISKAVVKEHLCADLFAVFGAYCILLYLHNFRVATQIFLIAAGMAEGVVDRAVTIQSRATRNNMPKNRIPPKSAEE